MKAWVLDADHPEDCSSRWHSDQAHVVERITASDGMNASYYVTIDDPAILTSALAAATQTQLEAV